MHIINDLICNHQRVWDQLTVGTGAETQRLAMASARTGEWVDPNPSTTNDLLDTTKV